MSGAAPAAAAHDARPDAAEAFEAARDAADSALRPFLERAYQAAQAVPPPPPGDEEARRIDPRVFDLAAFPPRSTTGGARPETEPIDEPFDVVLAVRDGVPAVMDRSGVVASGALEVTDAAGWARNDPERLERCYRAAAAPDVPPAALPPDREEALNAAMASPAVTVRVPAGRELERGMLLRVDLGESGGLLRPRVTVDVERGAAFNLVVCYTGAQRVPAAVSAVHQVYLAEGSRARVIVLQELGPRALFLSTDGGRVSRDARLDWMPLHLGARAVRSRLAGEAAGAGAFFRARSFHYATGRQQVAHRTVQIHGAADTGSDLLYKGIVGDAAYALFQGVIVARRGAVRIDAYQKNNNLLLDDGARADSLPGLLIDADDLRCSHGATIGSLDPDALFYLRSRGLDEAAARRHLLEGFAEEVLGGIPYARVRDRVRAAVARRTRPGGEDGE